jgi:hypothetical protein
MKSENRRCGLAVGFGGSDLGVGGDGDKIQIQRAFPPLMESVTLSVGTPLRPYVPTVLPTVGPMDYQIDLGVGGDGDKIQIQRAIPPCQTDLRFAPKLTDLYHDPSMST